MQAVWFFEKLLFLTVCVCVCACLEIFWHMNVSMFRSVGVCESCLNLLSFFPIANSCIRAKDR